MEKDTLEGLDYDEIFKPLYLTDEELAILQQDTDTLGDKTNGKFFTIKESWGMLMEQYNRLLQNNN